MGDPLSEDIDLGPVVNAAGLKTIYSQLNYLVCGIVDKR